MNQQQVLINEKTLQILPILPEKFVVDFANGIDVARDHIRVQRNRTGFINRCYDSFTGQSTRRQAEINANLADGVEGALKWLTELTNSVAKTNFALTQVNERVAKIQKALTELIHYSADTRNQLENLSKQLNSRCDELARNIARVHFEQRAQRNLDQVFNKWAAERFSDFSLAARCYAALEELRWGAFGDFCRTYDDTVRAGFIEDLTNLTLRQLVVDSKLESSQTRMNTEYWLTSSKSDPSIHELREALAYLGDWAKPEVHPFIYKASQPTDKWPITLPRICTANRIAKGIVAEIFYDK